MLVSSWVAVLNLCESSMGEGLEGLQSRTFLGIGGSTNVTQKWEPDVVSSCVWVDWMVEIVWACHLSALMLVG